MNPDSLNMPPAISETLIPTLNQTGFMTTWLDPYSQAFVKFAHLSSKPLLDIGAAYGTTTLAALETGAEVICCDPDRQHLEICAKRTPANQKTRLKLLQGSLPNQINLEDGSVGGIICSRVLHFLSGSEIEESIFNMSRWLCSGGKVFLITDTPYMKHLKSFLSLYEERKNQGELWPGVVYNYPQYFPTQIGFNLPDFFHPLDPDILRRVCTEAGLIVEQADFFARIDYLPDCRDDGREGVGIIAYKQ